MTDYEELCLVAKLLRVSPARGLTKTHPYPVLEVQFSGGWASLARISEGHYRCTFDPKFDYAYTEDGYLWEFDL
jgi:hypothetical protein